MRKLVTWFLMAAMVITSVEVNLNTVLADDNAYQSIDYENSTISDDIQPKTEDVSEECQEENDSIEQGNDELKNETNGMLEGQDPTIEEQNPEIDDCANSWRYQNGEEVQQRNQREVAEQSLYITQPNISRRGIDVSEHNGNINWDKVKADGVEFAIIRCGHGKIHLVKMIRNGLEMYRSVNVWVSLMVYIFILMLQMFPEHPVRQIMC